LVLKKLGFKNPSFGKDSIPLKKNLLSAISYWVRTTQFNVVIVILSSYFSLLKFVCSAVGDFSMIESFIAKLIVSQ